MVVVWLEAEGNGIQQPLKRMTLPEDGFSVEPETRTRRDSSGEAIS
jgi:hypothetical protein